MSTYYGVLVDYQTGEDIRPATLDELAETLRQIDGGGDAGTFGIDEHDYIVATGGRTVWVDGPDEMPGGEHTTIIDLVRDEIWPALEATSLHVEFDIERAADLMLTALKDADAIDYLPGGLVLRCDDPMDATDVEDTPRTHWGWVYRQALEQAVDATEEG